MRREAEEAQEEVAEPDQACGSRAAAGPAAPTGRRVPGGRLLQGDGNMGWLMRGGRRIRQGCLSAGFFLTLIGSAAAEDPPAGVEAVVADGRLTLQADGAPLAEVLRAIGAAGEFEVVLRGAFAAPVRESFADRPLEDAIRDLAEGHSVVVLRDDPGPEAGAVNLAEIRVIENPDLAASEDALPGEPPQDGAEEAGLEDDADDLLTEREAFRLSRLGMPPPTREDILIELGDPDQALRVAAVPKVSTLAPGAALNILAGVFAREDDPLVRSRAVAALTRLEGPGAGMLLRERALRDEDAELRMQALNALASSAGERSVTVLGRILAQDSDPQVREAAISALQRVGGWGRRYVENAAADRDPKVRTAAEQALAAWPPSPD
jgi:hypothetical protein